MSDLLLRRLGWPALMIHGDPVVLERWKWLRSAFVAETRSTAVGRRPRVLDAGCGNGAFSLWAAALGADVLGLSDAPDDLRKARARAAQLELPRASFEEFDLRRLHSCGATLGEFDAILCLEVIEHVLDDVALLRGLAERLRPGGVLFLSTPTDDHRPLFGETAHLSGIEDGRHVRWGYSPRQLADVVAAAGLRATSSAVFGGYLTQRVCGGFWRMQRISLPLAWALTLPLRAVTFIDDPITRRIGTPFMSVGAVARKPLPDRAPGTDGLER